MSDFISKKPTSLNYPKIVIVDTADIISSFNECCRGLLLDVDLKEILTQAVAMLLNGDGNMIETYSDFPDYSRLVSNQFLSDETKVNVIDKAVNELLVNLYNRLKRDGVIVNNKLNYFFDKFIGNDIVLHYIPY